MADDGHRPFELGDAAIASEFLLALELRHGPYASSSAEARTLQHARVLIADQVRAHLGERVYRDFIEVHH